MNIKLPMFTINIPCSMMTSINELLKPSSVFALIVYFTFAIQSIRGKLDPQLVAYVVVSVVSFYFGKKAGENGGVK